MEWNDRELAEAAGVISEIGAYRGPRRSAPPRRLTLRLSGTLALQDGMAEAGPAEPPGPPNPLVPPVSTA